MKLSKKALLSVIERKVTFALNGDIHVKRGEYINANDFCAYADHHAISFLKWVVNNGYTSCGAFNWVDEDGETFTTEELYNSFNK